MYSPVLLLASAGFGLLALHLVRGDGARRTDATDAGAVLAWLAAGHAAIAFLNGTGVGNALGGWRGVLGLAGLQVGLLVPTLYATWRLDLGPAILE